MRSQRPLRPCTRTVSPVVALCGLFQGGVRMYPSRTTTPASWHFARTEERPVPVILNERSKDGSLRFVETGWERERLLFLRAAERAQRDETLSQKALLDQPAAHSHHPGLAAGLDAVASLAELFEGDSDDPEEQRRRMEARQAAENVGVLLALAILLTERVLRRRDSQAEEATLRKPERESISQAEALFQTETNSEETQDLDWLEAEEPQLVL